MYAKRTSKVTVRADVAGGDRHCHAVPRRLVAAVAQASVPHPVPSNSHSFLSLFPLNPWCNVRDGVRNVTPGGAPRWRRRQTWSYFPSESLRAAL